MKKAIVGLMILCCIVSICIYAQKTTTTKTTNQMAGEGYYFSEFTYTDLWDRMEQLKYFSIDFGQNPDYNEAAVVSQKIKTISYYIDALNYLGAKGWEVVNVISREINLGTEYYYTLKKKR